MSSPFSLSFLIAVRSNSRRILLVAAPLAAALGLMAPAAQAQTYTLSTLATFIGTANGADPYAGVTVDSSGNLYGTTYQGGTNDVGTVFEIAAGTTTVSTLASFTGTNGTNPYTGVTIDGSGNLYGTTGGGGANGDGSVFKVASGSNTITTLASFTGSANGSTPHGTLTFDSSGNLYGTTALGGANNDGTIFKIAAGTTTITTLASFTGAGGIGSLPGAGLTIDSNGNLYGTTAAGGANNDGTIFKFSSATSTLSTLAVFNGTGNGSDPQAGLALDSRGDLFGTTASGGASSDGTVFEYSSATSALTTLTTFSGTANGANPQAGVTLDSSGNLYGTTYGGGASGDGTVFKLTSSAAAPEPSALLLLAPGMMGLFAVVRRRRIRNAA